MPQPMMCAKMTVWLALFSLLLSPGLAEAQTTCKIQTVKNPPEGLICNERGYVRGHEVQNTNRRFYAAHATGCAQECLQDVSCFSFRYEAESNACTTFFTRIRDNGFRKDPKSPFLFSNYACYKRTGVCGLRNSDFSDPVVHGDVNPGPTDYTPPKQQVALAPWSYISDGEGYARVITPSANSPVYPQPPGDSPRYALMNVSGVESLSLVQIPRMKTPKNNDSIRVRFQLNLIRADFSENADPKPLKYRITAAYGPGRTNNIRYLVAFDPQDFGTWMNIAGQFIYEPGFSEQTFSLNIISADNAGNSTVSSALFGIADVVFKRDF